MNAAHLFAIFVALVIANITAAVFGWGNNPFERSWFQGVALALVWFAQFMVARA